MLDPRHQRIEARAVPVLAHAGDLILICGHACQQPLHKIPIPLDLPLILGCVDLAHHLPKLVYSVHGAHDTAVRAM